MSECEDLLIAGMRMDKDRKRVLIRLFALSLLVTALGTACTEKRKETAAVVDTKQEDVAAEYLAPLQEEAKAYFAELAEEVIGSKPEEVRISFLNAEGEALKEAKSLSEILTADNPELLAGFISASDKGYTEDEIHAIILEAKERALIVDLYFNYNDDYIYQVRSDGVVIDKATGKDGGAMRERIDYDLTENREKKDE